MSAYEELVERCMIAAPSAWDLDTWVRVVLAEVRRTLETATPEMADAAFDSIFTADSEDDPVEMWLAMLHASPLEPPK